MSDVLFRGPLAATGSVESTASYPQWIEGARSRLYPFAKRSLDVWVAGIGLLLLMPFFMLVALLVKLDSPGPLFFSQLRVGKHGRSFVCWKIRSMYRDAEERRAQFLEQNEMRGGMTFKMKRDPRITRVGRWLRKTSIDELPQLWNVFRGDMSLVGPRPALPSEVALYTEAQMRRLSVKPGITCIWQVSGRSDIPFEDQVRLDVRYIHEQSFWLDLRLLLATVPAVVFARGAY